MTSHAAHLNDELLSAYLDGELPTRQAEGVEDHLEHCPGCRTRLAGLRRVVGTLARLEAAAPPPVLARRVQRRIALVQREAGFFESLERNLKGLSLDSPLVVSFAVILALAVIVYLFSHGVANRHGDLSLHVAPPEAVEGLMRDAASVEIDGRRLVREGSLWRQEGMAAEDPSTETAGPEAIEWDSPRGREIRRDHPWIDELLSLTDAEAVLFEADGAGPVLLTRAPPPPAS